MLIRNEDIIQSISEALQYISYTHPPDFIEAMNLAYEREEFAAAKDAIAQILINSRMCLTGHRPICQDTGIINVFLEVGMDVRFEGGISLEDLVNEGVRQAYNNPINPLRASIVKDPIGKRLNTRDNTPAVIHVRLVLGQTLNITVAAKGGGSENKARFVMLNPTDSVYEWIMSTVSTLGAGWCPPGMLGIGIGGTAEYAMYLAKKSLMEPINIQTLLHQESKTPVEELRVALYRDINNLGIGAQGLGGLTTVLDVKILEYPTHAASLPVALIPNCAATRHIDFSLTGTGPATFPIPDNTIWPKIVRDNTASTIKINLDQLDETLLQSLKPGDNVLLSGTLLTGRDAAHKRLFHLIENNQPLPNGLDLKGRFIYYVGPVDPVGSEVTGPAGPTTASRMDKFTPLLLQKTGLKGMIGKAERGPLAIEAIKAHKALYLIAIGGAAYLVSKAIRKARVVAFPELGMEAIYEFTVEDMPVTVAVDTQGQSIHDLGPKAVRITLQKRAKPTP